MPRSKLHRFWSGAAFAAALFVSAATSAATRPFHLVLEANPAAPFPFLGRFGEVELHVYPHGVRAETIWLKGFSANGSRDLTVENPLSRMYTNVPVAHLGSMIHTLAGSALTKIDPQTPPPVLAPVSGTVHGIAAQRYRIVYGEDAWIDLWTTRTLGDSPQLRALVQQLVSGISPMTGRSAAAIPGVPVYVELNFSHYKRLPLLKVKNLTFSADDEESALKVGRLYAEAPLPDSIWK